jgi:hypothetical protein
MHSHDSEQRFPEWRLGTWWQIELRQRAMTEKTPNPGWTLPSRMTFEVIAKETVDDASCYRIRVNYCLIL